MLVNTNGSYNTADGMNALYENSSGTYNTASGLNTLFSNTSGHHNTARGARALILNTTGSFNTAVVLNALVGNTTGTNNAALGYAAGQNLSTGNNNIDIVNAGVAGESNTIRTAPMALIPPPTSRASAVRSSPPVMWSSIAVAGLESSFRRHATNAISGIWARQAIA
jgi:hypothetical protein